MGGLQPCEAALDSRSGKIATSSGPEHCKGVLSKVGTKLAKIYPSIFFLVRCLAGKYLSEPKTLAKRPKYNHETIIFFYSNTFCDHIESTKTPGTNSFKVTSIFKKMSRVYSCQTDFMSNLCFGPTKQPLRGIKWSNFSKVSWKFISHNRFRSNPAFENFPVVSLHQIDRELKIQRGNVSKVNWIFIW